MNEEKELILKLSEGYSTQSKIANQFWLVLIICCVFTLTATYNTDDKMLLDLPFTLGKVKAFDFYQINIILLSVLIISFTSAMIQVIRTRKLIQKMIDALTDKNIIGNIHIQDYLDSTFSPTYNRVAPISQYLLGKNQFFNEGSPNKVNKFLATIFYIVLKATTFVILYLLPVLSISKCWDFITEFSNQNSDLLIYSWVLGFMMFMAFGCISILIIGDLIYITKVLQRLK